MKVKSSNNISNISPKATRIFTDREEPRAAFWKKYNTVKSELKTESSVNVLYYYGIGGIGKSSLLKQLIKELELQANSPKYLYFDFDNIQGTDRRSVLTSLKNILAEKYGFVFPLYEAGNFAYAQKIGEKADPVEIKSFIDRNPVLNATLKLADVFVPFLGTGIKLAEVADDLFTNVKAFLKGRDKEIKKVKYTQDPSELYELLPQFFANDLTKNLTDNNLSEPLVIFLDTYELLANELNLKGDPLKRDEWIRGDEGIIQNIPNTLWVMAGREHLKWESFDEGWKDALEQHLLGDLSVEDSTAFLNGAGIEDSELCTQLYSLTNGTPVYLDLCVDSYFRLKDRDIVPHIGMFGKNTNELVERFVRYLDDAQKDLIYFLACLQKWDDDLCHKIASDVLGNFSYTSYEKAKNYSFVLQSEEGCYNMHQTVRKVLIENCPPTLKNKAGQCIIDTFKTELQNRRPFDDEFVSALTYTTQAVLLIHKDRENMRVLYEEHIRTKLIELAEAGRFEQAEAIIDTLCPFKSLISDDTDRLYAAIVVDISYMFMLKGDYNSALMCAEESYNVLKRLIGDKAIETLRVKHNYARQLYNLGRHNIISHTGEHKTNYNMVCRARVLQEDILEKMRVLLGEDAHDTIKAMNNLANTLGFLGGYEENLEYAEKVYAKLLEKFGEDYINTIKAMGNLSIALQYAKRFDEALELQRRAYNRYLVNFGENHPYTLNSMSNLSIAIEVCGPNPCDEEILSLRETVLKKRREILGNNHPDTVKSMRLLADTLGKSGRSDEADALYEEARIAEENVDS